MHRLQALRPKDAWRNASQTGVLTLGHEVPVGSGFNPASKCTTPQPPPCTKAKEGEKIHILSALVSGLMRRLNSHGGTRESENEEPGSGDVNKLPAKYICGELAVRFAAAATWIRGDSIPFRTGGLPLYPVHFGDHPFQSFVPPLRTPRQRSTARAN